MGNLLKIVKGVNAGAEIALAEGVVTFGSGEDCDIVLADATLAAEAFALESAAGAVTFKTLPDGEPRIISPYVIFAAGGMEFAIGPEGETWPELKREAVVPPAQAEIELSAARPAESESAGSASAESASGEPAAAEPPAAEAAAAAAPAAAASESAKSDSGRGGCLWVVLTVLLVLLAFLVGLFFSRRVLTFVERRVPASESVISRFALVEASSAETASQEAVAAEAPSGEAATAEGACEASGVDALAGLVEQAGLSLETGSDGTRTVRGDFARRADRLEFAAAAYALDPALKLDLSDDETMRAGAEDLVFMLTEGRIKVESVTNRTVTLVGQSESRQALLETVAALCADLNRVKTIDDTRVKCEDGEKSRAPTAYKAVSPVANPFVPPPVRRGVARPKCPVAGIIVTPYPCLVMRDGSRLAPGATVGEWTVERISETEVTLRNGETEYKWRP